LDFRILQGLPAKIVYRKWRKLYLLSGKKIEEHTKASNIIVGVVKKNTTDGGEALLVDSPCCATYIFGFLSDQHH